jgi:signal transduction histidine kinase
VPVEPIETQVVPVIDTMRELAAAGEIAQAFLTAERPDDVYRLALERVAPLVGASFGCVFLREDGTDLLRVVSAVNWPERYAEYLDSMRVRLGNGPTGRAVLDGATIEVADVFADPELEDWWDSARELGFASSISLPLAAGSEPIGAATFYFREPESFREADRHLLRLVADQLAATAEKAHLIENLQRVNDRLREQNEDLEVRYREAAEAKKLKNEFLANISHELRTPLTAILGYAFLLKEEVAGKLEEEQATAVNKIEDAGGRLLGMIDTLLDLTNLRLGSIVSQPELCDAVALARSVVQTAGAPKPQLELMLDAPDERVPIHTDPLLVRRILQSLVSNALKFTAEGRVTVRVGAVDPAPAAQSRQRGPDVQWEVHDTGIGIDESHQELIFEEFRQADGSATRRFGGTGLGLAVARGLARRLGGDVTVQSKLNRGSKFVLRLPSSVVKAGQGR